MRVSPKEGVTMADARDPIADFIQRQAPKEIVSGLQVLAKLRMPLHDKRALDAQLADMTVKADDATKATAERVGHAMDVSDFPILSIENALEKYWSKLDPFQLRIPGPVPPPIGIPVGPQQRPSVCEVYYQTFRHDAADCACRAYLEALREGLSEYQAIIVGHFAGRRAARGLGCPV
jgi:hypothetical protein